MIKYVYVVLINLMLNTGWIILFFITALDFIFGLLIFLLWV
jgi:hypothetical protein